MKRLELSTGGHDFRIDDLNLLRDSIIENEKAQAWIANNGANCILAGVNVTATFFGSGSPTAPTATYNIVVSEGYTWISNELWHVSPANFTTTYAKLSANLLKFYQYNYYQSPSPVTYKDNSTHQVHAVRELNIDDGTGANIQYLPNINSLPAITVNPGTLATAFMSGLSGTTVLTTIPRLSTLVSISNNVTSVTNTINQSYGAWNDLFLNNSTDHPTVSGGGTIVNTGIVDGSYHLQSGFQNKQMTAQYTDSSGYNVVNHSVWSTTPTSSSSSDSYVRYQKFGKTVHLNFRFSSTFSAPFSGIPSYSSYPDFLFFNSKSSILLPNASNQTGSGFFNNINGGALYPATDSHQVSANQTPLVVEVVVMPANYTTGSNVMGLKLYSPLSQKGYVNPLALNTVSNGTNGGTQGLTSNVIIVTGSVTYETV